MKRTRDSELGNDSSSAMSDKRLKGLTQEHQPHRPRPKNEVWVEVPSLHRNKCAGPKQTHHTHTGDEDYEDDGVFIAGEAPPEDDQNDPSDDSVPIRTIDLFAFFDPDTMEYVSSETLLANDIPDDIVGAGIVRPHAEDDDLDDLLVPGQRLVLSSIVECNMHWVSDDDMLDKKIYIRTQHAWYILLNPARQYAPYHRTLQRHHHIADAVLSQSLEKSETTLDSLLAYINGPSTGVPLLFPRYMGNVTAEDLRSSEFVSYFTMVMDRLCDVEPRFYQLVLQANLTQQLYPDLFSCPTSLEPRPHASHRLNIEKNVLQHHDCTVVTPTVGAIAERLFSQQLRTVRVSNASEHRALLEAPMHPVHRQDPTSTEWVEPTDDPHVYRSILIDGTPYQSGDFVVVQVGDDLDKGRSKNATSAEAWCPSNRLANKKWFCKINYFFEKQVKGKDWRKFFHVQWLVHGSKTLLQEVAHPRALYWLNECDDLSVECIFSHCNVTLLAPGQPEPDEDVGGPENGFFLGLTLDDECHSFVQQTPQEIHEALSHCEKHKQCFPCGLSLMQEVHNMWTSLPAGGYTYLGVHYHINDFVYVHNHAVQGGTAILLDIAQITMFSKDMDSASPLRVRMYRRYDEIMAKQQPGGLYPQDNRRLVQTDVFLDVKLDSIEGKAFVACPVSARAKEDWVQKDDHFYCDLFQPSSNHYTLGCLLPSALPLCQPCYATALDSHLAEERLWATHNKLQGLELFAGAGGLSTGLEMSGSIETKWAVEFSPSAARTFQANHTDTVMYNQSSNCLLEHAINTSEGRSPPPLYSIEGRGAGELPLLPQRGEVDFIYGGPPCQSFSLMNHHRHPDDKRSTLVCNMVSYVEFYRPQYFLLENVVGIFSYHLNRQGQGKHVVKKLRIGVVKFILRALIALGYQVQFRVLQAGQYGAPQGRRRVIFLGARGDVHMPSYPAPQYAYPTPLQNLHLPNHETLYPTFRMGHGEKGHQCTPLPAVTISDAISDLPRFDWQNPHQVITQSKKDVQDSKRRQKQSIPSFNALRKITIPQSESTYPGFNKPTDYLSPPLTRYQMWLRGEGGEKVTYQYTAQFRAGIIERVCNIPMTSQPKPYPNHTDLPLALQQGTFLDNGKSKPHYQTVYGRLHGSGHFLTAMTSMTPNCKGGRVIHPNQKRVLTVREYARSQGFPDSYQFLSTNTKPSEVIKDQLRQIGNAVPVPLALALGKSIGNALIQVWRQGEDNAS